MSAVVDLSSTNQYAGFDTVSRRSEAYDRRNSEINRMDLRHRHPFRFQAAVHLPVG